MCEFACVCIRPERGLDVKDFTKNYEISQIFLNRYITSVCWKISPMDVEDELEYGNIRGKDSSEDKMRKNRRNVSELYFM